MTMNKPCYNCTKRFPACQDTCKDLLEVKAEQKAYMEKVAKARERDLEEKRYIRQHYNMMKRRMGCKK